MARLAYTLDGVDNVAVTTPGQVGATYRNVTGSSAITFESDYGIHGTGLKFATVSGGANVLDFSFNAANNIVQTTVEFTTPPSAPSATADFFALRYGTSTSGGNACRFAIGVTGNLAFFDSGNPGSTVATALPWNTHYRLVLNVEGGSTTASKVIAKAYPSGSVTPVSAGVNLTNANLTTNPISLVRLGNAGGQTVTFGFDELQMNDGAGSEIPAYAPAAVPPDVSASIGAAYRSINATGTPGSGGTLAYSITPTSGVSVPSNGVFIVPVGVTYTITATESPSGLTDTFQVDVPATSGSGGSGTRLIRANGVWR